MGVRNKKKESKATKREDKKQDASDGLFVAGERADFGDIAERPPLLSQDALRSRTKLKKPQKLVQSEPSRLPSRGLLAGAARNAAVPEVTSLRQPVKNKLGGTADLADYANKVREAYAAIKRQRLDSHTRR